MTTAPDGSPVELYLRLPPLGEAEIVHEAIPAKAEILELGSGVGRVTHELVRLGHPVVAVDESAEMLAHVRDAETVHARIEELDLGRRFECVLLMSNFVNVPDDRERTAYLETCARHVRPDGSVLIERHEPGWRPEAGARSERDGLAVSLEDVRLAPSTCPRPFATRRTAERGAIGSRRASSTMSSSVSICAPLGSSSSAPSTTGAGGSRRAYTPAHSRCLT